MHLDALFSQFIREKQFLGNISPRTVKSIIDCQRAYKRTLGDVLPTKENLKEFVIKLRARALRVTAAPARPWFAASRASSANARCAAIPDGVRYSENSENDERVLNFRHWRRRLRDAIQTPLAADIESVKITVADAPTLDIRISVPTIHGGPPLDIDRDFAEVTKEICRETGCEMVLDGVRTASGKPLVDGSPLLAQLGTDREVILSYVPRMDTDFDTCSNEVN